MLYPPIRDSVGRRSMGKVGRFVVNPSVGTYCQVRLDSGDTLFTCRLEDLVGRRAVARLLLGAPEGSAQATPFGALVHYVKDCASPADDKARCWALFATESEPGEPLR